MSTDLQFHRRSIRLPNHDYSSNGWYFVTICTHQKELMFGEIVDCQMVLNEFGLIVQNEWLQSKIIRNEIKLAEFVIMPNHTHTIVIIDVGANGRSPLQTNKFRMKSKSISSLMAGFKSTTTNQINQIRKTPKQPLWQRNYWEHIIRNDDDLKRIERYIENNPAKWNEDRNNPRNIK